ncbi:hypothetical protein LNK15_11915, partial [Jeotgalicoccus huakuii]|nr:hypothetical protein [Jeotgalicoccus huakuii]
EHVVQIILRDRQLAGDQIGKGTRRPRHFLVRIHPIGKVDGTQVNQKQERRDEREFNRSQAAPVTQKIPKIVTHDNDRSGDRSEDPSGMHPEKFEPVSGRVGYLSSGKARSAR